MQTTGKLFDDLAKMANGAAGAFSGIRQEMEGMVKHRMERVLADMDLVTREEFEAMADVARRARSEQEKLERRVADLEARLGGKKAAAKKGTAKKAARKAAAKASGAKKPAAKSGGAKSGSSTAGKAG